MVPVLSSEPVKAWIWAWRSRKQAGDFLKDEWWAQTPSGYTGWGPAYLRKSSGSPASWTKVRLRPPGGLLPPYGEEDAGMNDSVLMKKLRSQGRARMGVQHT